MFYFERTERKLYLCFYLDSGPKLSVRQADGLFAARSPETLYRDTARCSPTVHRSLSVTFWTFPCSARGVDTGDRSSADSWTGFGK